MSASEAVHRALGWKWPISPQMNWLSAAVGCKASLNYGGNYSFHLFPNVKNVCRPLCYQATWTLDIQICWHIWVAALRMAFVNYFITYPNNHPEGGLDLWSVTVWCWHISGPWNSLNKAKKTGLRIFNHYYFWNEHSTTIMNHSWAQLQPNPHH